MRGCAFIYVWRQNLSPASPAKGASEFQTPMHFPLKTIGFPVPPAGAGGFMQEPPALSVAGKWGTWALVLVNPLEEGKNTPPPASTHQRPIGTRWVEDWGGALNLQTRQLRAQRPIGTRCAGDWGGLICGRHFWPAFLAGIFGQQFWPAFLLRLGPLMGQDPQGVHRKIGGRFALVTD